jgi:hypothetical protein
MGHPAAWFHPRPFLYEGPASRNCVLDRTSCKRRTGYPKLAWLRRAAKQQGLEPVSVGNIMELRRGIVAGWLKRFPRKAGSMFPGVAERLTYLLMIHIAHPATMAPPTKSAKQ